jgi:hypothetical protein
MKRKKPPLNPNPKLWLPIWLMGRELTLILMSIDSASSKMKRKRKNPS